MKVVNFGILLLVSASFLGEIQGARLARSNCNGKWNQYQSCFKNAASKSGPSDSSFPVPNDGDKRRYENGVNDCFIKQFRCSSSPIPNNQQRRDCFNQVKKTLQANVQKCVRNSITDFNMPDDPYDPQNDWGYTVLTVQNAVKNPKPFCPSNPNKNDLQNCVAGTGYDFIKRRPPNKPAPYACQADADCWYNWGFDCQNTWEYQIVPQICQCSQDMQKNKAVKNAQDQYRTCLSGKGQTMAKDDAVLKWFDNYLRGMCTTATNSPCKKERDGASRRLSSQKGGIGK